MIGPLARLRRGLYGAGVFRSRSLPRPVVSIGNLTAGGSGKTPHVQFFAGWLTGVGIRVAVLSRGYGRRSRGVVWASGEGRAPTPAEEAGDEPALLAASLPGVPVVVGESRFEAGRECLRRREVDVFLLDDGFQHLSLRRDADLLLVDAERGLGNGRTLPFGPLREPPDHARFADALVVTRCDGAGRGEQARATLPFPPGRPVAFSRVVPRGLVDREGREVSLPSAGTEIAAFSGIAGNERFASTLRASGFAVRAFVPFGDHHWYAPGDLERVRVAAEGLPVVTTEKDMIRLPPRVPFPVRALRIGVEFLAGWEGLSGLLLQRIERGGRG